MLRLFRRPADLPELRLYTKPDCCLCDDAKAELEPLRRAGRFRLVEVDILGDPALEERYGRSIPVLEWNGRALAKGRFTAEEAMRRLERRRRS